MIDAHRPDATARARASSSATRCSRSTRATSRPASSCPTGRGASTASRSTAPARWPASARRPRAVPRRPAAAAPSATLVELDDLVRFVEHPVRAFLRQRLGISVGDYADEVEDALPVELDALEQWGVGQRLLDARLAGVGRADARSRPRSRAARCRPGVLGEPVIDAVLPDRRGDRRRRRGAARASAAPARSTCKVDAARRPPAERHRPRRRAATLLRDGHLLARQPAPPARRLGAAARADRRAPGAAVRGGDDRPRALGRATRA